MFRRKKLELEEDKSPMETTDELGIPGKPGVRPTGGGLGLGKPPVMPARAAEPARNEPRPAIEMPKRLETGPARAMPRRYTPGIALSPPHGNVRPPDAAVARPASAARPDLPNRSA